METSKVRIMWESPTPSPPCNRQWTIQGSNLEGTLEYLENGEHPVGDADGNEKSSQEKVDQQEHRDPLQTWNIVFQLLKW